MTSYFLDPKKLNQYASEHAEIYRSAEPFPYIVIDDFFPDNVLETVLSEFPRPGDIEWSTYRNEVEHKLACEDETKMGPETRHFLHQCNSSPFLSFLEELTGIESILVDPHLRGGGMHQIEPGGFLKVHADFNWYPRLKVHRRLNLLVYLNKDWKEAYGGHLELWDKSMNKRYARILPVFNRAVIFNTTDEAMHGHPDPLACPPNRFRRSIALYYYTTERPEEEKHEAHSTLFRARPGELLHAKGLRNQVKQFIPPVVLDLARRARRRLKK